MLNPLNVMWKNSGVIIHLLVDVLPIFIYRRWGAWVHNKGFLRGCSAPSSEPLHFYIPRLTKEVLLHIPGIATLDPFSMRMCFNEKKKRIKERFC